MSYRYPAPDIQLFPARIEDSLRPSFTPAQLKTYQTSIYIVFFGSPPLDIVGKALQKTEADHPDSDNWHASFFLTIFGGARAPVASSNWVFLRMKPPLHPSLSTHRPSPRRGISERLPYGQPIYMTGNPLPFKSAETSDQRLPLYI